ncbi:transglutaminase family protein [Gordonia amarae]|uniref:Transglutaminase-like domain-containing protein n=2 Tax=Gordonia amarae TaxID=36821 RepID=G7GJP6_9ACTN|nr:transglutaminase family protein [Gordonia amarae]MCS3879783.1 transglutaminase-like putative cysteine protease [Gordonia amarae]QHN18210.1 transglutaminase family protein [Gordonia amarae]QHN22694.1 transglutaminase family protein [Gordonia amarae]QHN31597.1 transglutaminase family protein [Gordonia amarae]QHN40341.1 transglutaminase family protein [Gordonia amarae]
MSWRLRVVHSTGFAYKSPVTSSYNEARLTPRSDHRQNVIVNRVETVPSSRAYRYTDYWGSAVTAFDLHAPHNELEVSGMSVVETDAGERPDEQASWDDLHTEYIEDRYDEMLTFTAYVPKNRSLGATAKRLAKGKTPEEAVEAICKFVYDEMEYVPGTTGVHTTAVDAWNERKGVCQDYAHLTLLMLRSLGIPARYVSGYLHPDPEAPIDKTVAGQSHAWIEAWTGGWWGYDPTNDTPITERHVSVGVGRDYADVSPLRGVYTGGGATDLDVVVEITRLA